MDSKENPKTPQFNPPPYSQPQPAEPPQIGFPEGVVPVPTVIPLGPSPQRVTCPSCHANIQTVTKSEASTKTHLIALVMCCVGCWCCCCIPYFMDSCMSTQHTCPNCGSFIGTYSN